MGFQSNINSISFPYNSTLIDNHETADGMVPTQASFLYRSQVFSQNVKVFGYGQLPHINTIWSMKQGKSATHAKYLGFVGTWKHLMVTLLQGNAFHNTGSFVRGIHQLLVVSPQKEAVILSFDVFFVAHLNNQFNKQFSCQNFFYVRTFMWLHSNVQSTLSI